MESIQMMNDRQAAKLLNIGLQTLRNWRSQHRGPDYIKIGRSIRYNATDLRKFIKSKKIQVNN
jgi:hypothetical protein